MTRAAAAFRTAYADPVLITQRAGACGPGGARRPLYGVIDRFDAGDRAAVVFRQTGVHIGMFPDASTEPTGAIVSGLGIDVFTFADGVIAEIWVVSELAAQLSQASTGQS